VYVLTLENQSGRVEEADTDRRRLRLDAATHLCYCFGACIVDGVAPFGFRRVNPELYQGSVTINNSIRCPNIQAVMSELSSRCSGR
jgi:hypothetical protein